MVNYYDNFDKLIDNICKILKLKSHIYKKGDTITTYIEKRNQIGIIISGHGDLIRYDSNGTKVIVDSFTNTDIFGEFFYSVNNNNELKIIADEDTELILFNYDDLINKDLTRGQTYAETITLLLMVISNKILELNNRIEVLTKRTIREKLLAYFESISSLKHRKTFYLTFSLSDLADYLSIDRSAMMREIKNLTDDGIIKKDKKKITLIEH